MTISFEKRLIAASSTDSVKTAKQLLKKKCLICGYRDQAGQRHGVFMEKDTYYYVAMPSGELGNGVACSCSSDSSKLCSHAVALIMYLGRNPAATEPKPAKQLNGQTRYAGLKYKDFGELAGEHSIHPQAEVIINVESAFPHVPSKWENAILAVKLKTGSKEYVGNLNNLRQLYFSKSLAVSLQLSHFSLQDQQIIRFLAINSDPDNSKLLLNSEQTSEFFHCLIGFDRFFRDGSRMIVHAEAAQPVMLCRRRADDKIAATPGIKIGNTHLPVTHARVITGRSGCWLGFKGEYWWVAATVDIGWLRNFFRSGEQSINAVTLSSFRNAEMFPVPVENISGSNPGIESCRIMLDGKFDDDNSLKIKLSFIYKDKIFPANHGRLAIESKGNKFWYRDEIAEKKIEKNLIQFGFNRVRNVFSISNTEAIGVFLDQLLPELLNSEKNYLLTGELTRIACGGRGLLPISLQCHIAREFKDKFLIGYELKTDGLSLTWSLLTKAAKAGKHYYMASKHHLTKISPPFRAFLIAAENVMQKLDDNASTFELMRCSVHYWCHLGENIPGANPPEFSGHINIDMENFSKPGGEITISPLFAGELRHYQKEGMTWLKQLTENGFNVILADEMGLGKTVQALAMLALGIPASAKPALIICPAGLTENWRRECNRFVPSFKTAKFEGNNTILAHIEDYHLLIMSYAAARRNAGLLKHTIFSYLILDEAQHIKNPGTANARSCKLIHSEHRLVLTGTPLENSSEDLWSIFDFLHPGMLGTFTAFKKFYNGIKDNQQLQQDLAVRVSPFIKRRTKQLVCRELPPKHEQILFCEMDQAQRTLYEKFFAAAKRQVVAIARQSKGKGKSNFEVLTALLRLRQICCDPTLLPDNIGRNTLSAKTELLKELVLQNIDSNHKMLLFSQFTSFLKILRDWLDTEQIAYEYLDGSTRNRMEHVDNFNQNSQIPVFLLSLKAGGVGLNLTSADTVIICDPWWNPAVETQATDRTHRIGQTRPVNNIKVVVKDSVEEKILQLQNTKQEMFDNIIENPALFADKLSIEDLRMLFQ